MCHTHRASRADDEGVYVRGPAGLGMRRLSIIDLSTGHQPIHNEDRSVWVVLNGEIYNYQELRRTLEDLGHQFCTNTDTEVIVHLYEQYGADCVNNCAACSRFALWNERAQRLLLARDRFGKKPLHYAFHNGRLLFGSEIKEILAVAPDLADVSPDGVLNFFYFGYVPDPLTAFSAIHKLPPGHLLEFSNGEIQIRQYWDLPPYGGYEPKSKVSA